MASLTASGLSRLLGEWNVGATPGYRELADVVRLLVLDGRVALDTALPSERALSEALGVSRTMVTAAYGLLREQGFLTGGQGSRSRTRIPRLTPAGTTLFTGPVRSDPALTAPGLAAPEGLIDLAYASLPASGEVVHRAFAAALPLLLWVPFFAGAQRLDTFGTSLELWTGACVMAALGGLALSTLIVPPALPAEAREALSTDGPGSEASRQGGAD